MRFVLIAAIFLIAGCTGSTKFGECIGAFDDKDPKKVYKVSAWNVFLGVVGSSLILPPIFVVVDQTFCPVADKKITAARQGDE